MIHTSSYAIPISRLITRPMLTCAPSTTVREVARRISAERCSCVVVMKDSEAIGIWTEQDALASSSNAGELDRPISAVMSAPLLTLDASTSLGEAAVHFKQSGIRHFGVFRDGKCIGVLTQTDVVVNQGAEFFLRLKPIEAIHVQPLVVVAAHRPLRDAIALMRARQLDAIVVEYAGGEHGILTERDVVRLIANDALGGAAGDHASRPLQTLPATQSLYAAQHHMMREHIRHVGVRDVSGCLVGLLSFADILQNIEDEYVNKLQTKCSRWWPRGCANGCAQATPSRGWAAMSSHLCWRSSTTSATWAVSRARCSIAWARRSVWTAARSSRRRASASASTRTTVPRPRN